MWLALLGRTLNPRGKAEFQRKLQDCLPPLVRKVISQGRIIFGELPTLGVYKQDLDILC